MMKVLGRTGVAVATVLVFTALFTVLGYDSSHWNGLDESNDETPLQKINNRLYFSVISCSSIGYGDISPQTHRMKGLTMILALVVIVELITVFL
tara:strand:- start:975 stop:1256 length:282 start_codon:yes stop_codon:yes gene_type:complete